MNYKRLIPVILIKDGLLVRSQVFKYHQAIGDPIPTIKRLSDWSVDEIVFINIGLNSSNLDSRRDDKWHNIGQVSFKKLVEESAKFCFAPLTVGGGISTLVDFSDLFKAGADKCLINTAIFKNPNLVKEAVKKFGSQAIVASLDVKKDGKKLKVFTNKGNENTGFFLDEAIKIAVDLGIGEIILSSIDNDGSGKGYDTLLLENLPNNIEVPIIINSGAKEIEHFSSALKNKKIDAAAAANIFYFSELSYPIIKRKLITLGNNLRNFDLSSNILQREPVHDSNKRNKLLAKANPNSFFSPEKYNGSQRKSTIYCKKCLYPSFSATPMEFDGNGICMGCISSDIKLNISGEEFDYRKKKLLDIIYETKNESNDYDCIIPVSGGKDSYYQTHYVTKILGLRPLLVTYNGNNFSDVGMDNLMRMKEVFNCDHIIFQPSVGILKKLNKLAFIAMGDMNWHNHVGIATIPSRLAVQFKIPLIFQGEHGYTDLCGQFSMDDYPEYNYREILEHDSRGFNWSFFDGLEGINSQDLTPWKYPSDQELLELNLRIIFLGHYIPWEANEHLEMMIEKYHFQVSDEPFDRTYRRGSNLDDIHENGVHDYMKFIKFGYGRCTDHASKDIRASKFDRRKGIELVKKMDHIKSRDLKRWLSYVDMTEKDFDRIADHFRDPRVWEWDKEKGWIKDDLK
tara:strand:+ start:736 stop:2781 length:2046 start_codon:yes stop_codon:yes gene_type:complete